MTTDTKETESKIFSIYARQLCQRMVNKAGVEEHEIPVSEFESSISDIKNRLKIKLKANGVCSTLLIQQLGRHKSNLGEVFGDKVEYYNSSEILDLIELIEDETIKIDDPKNCFKHKPLKGLFKVHHGAYSGQGYSLMLNVCKYWFDRNGTLHNKKREYFNAIVDNIGLRNLTAIAQQMHIKAVLDKESGLTGEWLVIYRKSERNYYLCLATHDEGDQNIFDEKIVYCINELPVELCEVGT